MRRLCWLLILFSLSLSAQQANSSAPESLPKGVRFLATLKTNLDTAKLEEGQSVNLEVTANLRGPGNRIVLPTGARLLGRVVHVSRHSKELPSELAIIVERAEWEGGSLPLRAGFANVQPPNERTVSLPVTERPFYDEELLINNSCRAGDYKYIPEPGASNKSKNISGDVFEGVSFRSDPQFGSVAVTKGRSITLETGVRLYLVQLDI